MIRSSRPARRRQSLAAKAGRTATERRIKAMDTTYNGWTNYETWVTKLWMDNEEGSYYHWRERAQEYAESGESFMEDAYNLSQELKDTYEESMPETVGVWRDLLRSAFQAINWYEIAESLLNE